MSKPLKQSTNSPSQKSWRFLNRDGSFNIARGGYKKAFASDLYHSLLSASWPGFLSFVILVYLSINLIFAGLFFLCGPGALEGVRLSPAFSRFIDSFFFSVQTIATIGYGRISPFGLVPNVLVTVEALMGLLSLALMTGLLYARFARPTARVIFSQHALIAPLDGIPSFVFRIANERLNQISEAHVNAVFVKTERTREGETYRKICDLKLTRNHSPIFALTWTVIHPIDSESPLLGMAEEDLRETNAEILITVTGIDDTFSQSIHARFSYVTEDLIWGARFKDMVSRGDDGKIHIDLKKIHDIETTE